MIPSLSALLSRCLVDRREGHRRAVLHHFRNAARFDYLDDDERERVRVEKLAELLRAAGYTERLSKRKRDLLNVKPEDARVVLQSLPKLTRAEIQDDLDACLTRDRQTLSGDATGGSSGTPMVFMVDRSAHRAREASLMWANSLAGWQEGERIAMLWGSDRDVSNALQHFRLGVRWWIENRRWYNAFNMGRARMAQYHRDMQSFKPHIIVAYAGAMAAFARFIEQEGMRPRYPLKSIVCSAELLTEPMRGQIERNFGKPVFNRYGNREAGAIAAECISHSGLHINEHGFVIEVDSEDPYTIPGPILITHLENRGMPFVRYDTGDVGMLRQPQPCACGRHTEQIATIAGRETDLIRTPVGNLIHGEFFTHILYGNSPVRNFQFIQETRREYRLLLVAEEEIPKGLQQQWRDRILEALGAGSNLVIEQVETIAELPSGKHRFTVSKLPK